MPETEAQDLNPKGGSDENDKDVKKAKVRQMIKDKLAKKQAGEPSTGREKAAKEKRETKAKIKGATPKDPKPCRCRCGELVNRDFKPGHDARYYGWMKKVVDGKMKFSELHPDIRKEVKTVEGAKAMYESHHKKH